MTTYRRDATEEPDKCVWGTKRSGRGRKERARRRQRHSLFRKAGVGANCIPCVPIGSMHLTSAANRGLLPRRPLAERDDIHSHMGSSLLMMWTRLIKDGRPYFTLTPDMDDVQP